MADRYYSNADEGQRFQPGTTAEAGQVDGKFDEVTAGFQAVAADTDRSLKLPGVTGTSQEIDATPLQRRRRVVGFDADGNLTLLQGFGWRGNWAAATEYFVNDVFRDPATKNLYVTLIRHTSAAALSTDITAGRVELAISVEDVEQLKADTQQIKDDAVSETTTIKNTAVTAASTATTKASDASNSASTATAAASTATTKASEASGSASAASSSASAASTAANTATTKAGEASTSASNAANSESKAQQWAEAEGEVEPGQFSAKYWVGQAQEIVLGDTVITDLQPGAGNPGQIVTPGGAGGLVYDDITIAYVQGLQEALNAKRALTNTSFPRYDLVSVSQTGTGTITLDLAQAQSFRHAVTGTTTFEFSNAQGADRSQPVALYLYDASLGTRVINYPSGVNFGDQAPDFTDKTWALVLFFWSGHEWIGSVGTQG